MDTGAYMANQMDNFMESGNKSYEAFVEDLDNRIEAFIKENGYTFTVNYIVEKYRNDWVKGNYVSYTTKKVIQHFEADLKKSTGL